MREFTRARILLPAAGFALAGHAVAYGTFWPSGAAHGYFAWYEPALGAASTAAVIGLAVVLVLALSGSPRAKRMLGSIRPSTASPARCAHRLALTSLAILLVQETLESSLASGRFVPGAFSGSSLLFLVAFLWLASLALVYAARTYVAIARRVSRPPRLALRALGRAQPRHIDAVLRPPSPLAVGRALRAPPLLPA
jgi:hypothetical protein